MIPPAGPQAARNLTVAMAGDDRPPVLTVAGELALGRKASDVVEIDLRGIVGYTDWFLVCTGNTERQAKAIHDAIHLGLKQRLALLPRRVEGASEARWILMDYLDAVIHVFTPNTRDFYRLESLWGDAPKRTLQ